MGVKKLAELLGGTQAERMARAAEQGFDTAKVWYHGANRLDRLLEKPNIQSKRATSGPMPFFTDNPEIASNYANGKVDTSRLADYDFDYNDWFKVSSGRGKAKRLDQAWHYLSPEEQARIRDSIGKVTQDDEGLFMAGDGPGGQAHWEWTLKQHRGNALAAARDVWLDSGNLFNDEEKFMEVLRRGGLDRPVQYDSPYITAPGVLPVYSRVANPMDTSNQEALSAVASAIERAAKGKRSRSGFGVDQWDKNTIGLKEFSARLQDDLKNGTTHAWTSIPDDVTAVIKGMGYDGILDRGGKNGGYGHNVLIPFDENQIRSINADFNPANIDSNNLLAGIQSAAPIGAGALLAGAALAPEDAEAGVITKGGKRLIEAWHGSPHSFDKFDISKIGTGEGAQAYGHGLYFADAKETAKEYRDALANKNLFQANTENGYAAARAAGLDAGFADDAVRSIQLGVKDFDEFRRTQKKVWGKDIPESARLVFDTILKSANDGFLYRTHIDVDPDTLLDWDRPLSEQSPRFRDAILALPEVQSRIAAAEAQRVRLNELHPGRIGKIPGADIPIDASRINGDKLIAVLRQSGLSEKEVSQKLLDMGIPGIRYRDQMSRGDTAEPTFNYVMFDDKPISIVERGNASPELLATAATATAAAIEANNAINNFQSRRASKRDYWRQMRQEITDFASAVAGGAFAALDKPLQGYMGLAGVAGTLAAGGTLPQALQQGARIAAQPSEATAYQYGGAMTDALAPYSPQGAAIAGALTNAGVQLISPL